MKPSLTWRVVHRLAPHPDELVLREALLEFAAGAWGHWEIRGGEKGTSQPGPEGRSTGHRRRSMAKTWDRSSNSPGRAPTRWRCLLAPLALGLACCGPSSPASTDARLPAAATDQQSNATVPQPAATDQESSATALPPEATAPTWDYVTIERLVLGLTRDTVQQNLGPPNVVNTLEHQIECYYFRGDFVLKTFYDQHDRLACYALTSLSPAFTPDVPGFPIGPLGSFTFAEAVPGDEHDAGADRSGWRGWGRLELASYSESHIPGAPSDQTVITLGFGSYGTSYEDGDDAAAVMNYLVDGSGMTRSEYRRRAHPNGFAVSKEDFVPEGEFAPLFPTIQQGREGFGR